MSTAERQKVIERVLDKAEAKDEVPVEVKLDNSIWVACPHLPNDEDTDCKSSQAVLIMNHQDRVGFQRNEVQRRGSLHEPSSGIRQNPARCSKEVLVRAPMEALTVSSSKQLHSQLRKPLRSHLHSQPHSQLSGITNGVL